MIEYRPERAEDFNGIDLVVAAAFGDGMLAVLVRRIRASEHYVPELSFVADDDGAIVAHTMLSYLVLDTGTRVLQLSPMAVAPERQRQGIGSGLIRAVLAAADRRGDPLVVLVGNPRYYERFGFRPCVASGLLPPESHPDAPWQVVRLTAYDDTIRGRVVLPPVFDGIE